MTNCKNCGAPLLKNGDCEYCGTKNQSGIMLVPSSCHVVMDAPKIGKMVAPRLSEILFYADNRAIYEE